MDIHHNDVVVIDRNLLPRQFNTLISMHIPSAGFKQFKYDTYRIQGTIFNILGEFVSSSIQEILNSSHIK